MGGPIPATGQRMTIRVNRTIKPQRLRRMLRRMLDIYSPSGKEEEILDYLHGYLKRQGLPVIQQEVDENRWNLVVLPEATGAQLALVGHVDTVAAYELEDFGHEEDGDSIIGLGAADMKGGCAAMIEAYLTAWNIARQRLPAALALVVGEEEDGDGAVRLGKEYHFPWVVVGEPTNLQLCLSHYGYIETHITTHGRRLHASLADRGHNPIQAMLHLLLKVSHHLEAERPEIVYNVRDLSSSRSGFAVPERCDAWFDIHLPPHAPTGEIVYEVEEVFNRTCRENSGFHGSVRFTTIHGGYEIPQKGPFVETLREVLARHSLSWEPQSFRSHSDANLLWEAGMKPVLLGPGQLEQAHTPTECVSLQQVYLAAELYLDLLLALTV